jgi:coenzyme PQQ biosynthesis protein PqqD
MFAGNIMHVRIAAFEEHYPWVDTEGLRYFRSRTTQAPRDAENGLAFVTEYTRNEEDQARCVAALERKCEILWNLLDAVVAGCSRPVLSNGALLRDDPAEGGSVAVLPERAVKLNATGRTILDLCDGNRSAVAIAAHVRERHTGAEDGIESDTHAFLAEMRKLGVIRFAT